MRHTLLKRHLTLLLLLLCLFVFISACGTTGSLSTQSDVFSNKPLGVGMTPEPGTDGKPAAPPTQPAYEAQVAFAASTPFAQALRAITDLGLQTERICIPTWRPQQSSEVFSTYHTLNVVATVNSAPLWLARLQASPGVTAIRPFSVINCPMERLDNNPPFLGLDKAGTYLRVTFAPIGYDTALNAVNDMGFRLANPCYEQARARGSKPTWTTMGQDSSYAQTHMLLLATTPINATTWQSQLQNLAGVERVEVIGRVGC